MKNSKLWKTKKNSKFSGNEKYVPIFDGKVRAMQTLQRGSNDEGKAWVPGSFPDSRWMKQWNWEPLSLWMQRNPLGFERRLHSGADDS